MENTNQYILETVEMIIMMKIWNQRIFRAGENEFITLLFRWNTIKEKYQRMLGPLRLFLDTARVRSFLKGACISQREEGLAG